MVASVHEPAGMGFLVAGGQPVRAEVLVGLVAGEHVVGGDRDRVRDRDLGAGPTAAAHQAGVLDGEVVLALHPAHRPGSLDEDRGQPRVAPSPAGGGCVCQRTHTSPVRARPRTPGAPRTGTATCPVRLACAAGGRWNCLAVPESSWSQAEFQSL